MNKTIGILAHVDAGKTTFAEQLLFHTNSIRERGRVDHRNSFMDSHAIERSRGITIFSDQALMHYNGSDYYLVDTPGHVDFSPEMERAVRIMDYAVMVVSGIEGVEGHTETVWRLLRKHAVPTFFFINKMDRETADVNRVLEEIRLNLTADCFDVTDAFNGEAMTDSLREFLAERDELLLERYMEGDYDHNQWLNGIIRMIGKGKLFPCCSGSALHDKGVREFLDRLDQLTVTGYETTGPFEGSVYKIRHDESGTRITFIKALKGTLKVRDLVSYGDDESRTGEKITQIRLYSGSRYQVTETVKAGQLFGVTGLTNASIGDGLGNLKSGRRYEMIPSLRTAAVLEPEYDPKEVLGRFRLLEAEDPSLNVVWDETLQTINLQVMGVVQLEILQQVLKDRFNLEIRFKEPEILYKETINRTVTGYGHFEPLRHYAEVHLRLEPGTQNSGITFVNDCQPDVLTKGQQHLVRQHILEGEHHGLLTGSALTDVKVSLLTGRAHVKHTSGGDFREATFRALRQGLEKAESVLLEPWYRFRITVEVNQIGRVLSDVQKASGIADPPETVGGQAVITGKVPVSTFMNYSKVLASFTGGKGMISLLSDGYYPCHNGEEVIMKMEYNKNADFEYTSSSVFCSKGQSYTVSWCEAEEKMHGL
ncbi:MAG TPA: TetM/TetW/TetO/TetS family tetracycline resistance ribosomal protection protein [Thermotogota bacterium]|nr:TetM/TetW/TetO/TetS family tetracycline resistance ribosomal protection protein [Thermotogota bacterium]